MAMTIGTKQYEAPNQCMIESYSVVIIGFIRIASVSSIEITREFSPLVYCLPSNGTNCESMCSFVIFPQCYGEPS